MTDFRQGTVANPVNIGPFRQLVKIEGKKKKPPVLGGSGYFHWGGPILGEFRPESGFSTLGGFHTPMTDPVIGLNWGSFAGDPAFFTGDVQNGVGAFQFPVGGTYQAAAIALVYDISLLREGGSATIAILNGDTGEILAAESADVPPGGNITIGVSLSRRPVPTGHAAYGITVGATGHDLAVYFPSSTFGVTHFAT